VYRASMQVWGAGPNGRGKVAAAIADPDATVLDGLTLIVAARDGAAVSSVRGEVLRDGVVGAEVDTSGVDEVIVVVVSHATDGQSKRPGLCIGDPAEVASCVSAKVPAVAEPEVEAAPEAAEVGPEAVEAEVEVEPVAEVAEVAETTSGGSDEGCGAASVTSWALGLLGIALALGRGAARRRLSDRRR
jgi:hypothetical protein